MSRSERSKVTLNSLARQVEALADSAAEEAALLHHVDSGLTTYLGGLRAVLTGKPMPGLANPGPGGPIVISTQAAMDTLSGVLQNVQGVLGAAAELQNAKAKELDAVRGKEVEEKGGDPPRGEGGGSPVSRPRPETGGAGQGQDDGTTTRPRDPASVGPPAEVPPPSPEGTDPGNTTTGNPDTTTTTPAPADPGHHDPTPPTGANPPAEPPAEPPVIPKGDGTPKIIAKRTRRCFRFWLENHSTRPASDLHFDAPGVKASSAGVGGGTDVGWEGCNVVGEQGVLFRAKPEAPPLPPGRRLGPFEFCTESEARGFKVYMTHPQGPPTEIGPSGLRVPGGRPARLPDGTTVFPHHSSETVYDVEVTLKQGGTQLTLGASGGKIAKAGTGSNSVVSDSPGFIGVVDNLVDRPVGESLRIHPPEGRQFQEGEKVTVQVTSSSPFVTFRVI